MFLGDDFIKHSADEESELSWNMRREKQNEKGLENVMCVPSEAKGVVVLFVYVYVFVWVCVKEKSKV